MIKQRLVVMVTYALICLLFTGTSAFAQAVVDQHAVAAALLGGDRAEKIRAVDRARAVGRDASPQLRSALITTLERESAMRAERWRSAQRGETLEPIMDDLYGSVAQAVVELRDPAAIPALAGALGTGMMVIRALVEFGEPAVPAILSVISTPDVATSKINDGLRTLRLMVEEAEPGALAPGTLAQMRGVARRHLTGRQPDMTLWNAIDLAVVLEDEELRGLVETLASDPDEVRARGVEEPDLIERVQERAAEALRRPSAPGGGRGMQPASAAPPRRVQHLIEEIDRVHLYPSSVGIHAHTTDTIKSRNARATKRLCRVDRTPSCGELRSSGGSAHFS